MSSFIFNRFELDSPENQKIINKLQTKFKINLSEEKIAEILIQLSRLQGPDNSSFIKSAKRLFKEAGCNIKMGQFFEIFSKLLGEKNWNIVKHKNISLFHSIFSNLPAIPTGLSELDFDLHGGLRRGELVTILGPTNSGKSHATINLGANALRAINSLGQSRKLKVLHISLDGIANTLQRYRANLGSEADNMDRLKTFQVTNFGFSEKDLLEYVTETYQNFKFDVLIINKGQLISHSDPNMNYRQQTTEVFRMLKHIAQNFNCVVISPVQATKYSINKEVLRSQDIAEAFEIASISSTILTLNRTTEQIENNQALWFLEKQRVGVKNKQYLVDVDFSKCQLL